jgi:valyl-tRNA synthetase
VKVTPAHDPNDYAVWQRQAGKIEILNILNANGTLNENAGPYAGMKREPARKQVIEDLTAQGLLEKEEPYETQVGHSDRSKTPVEPYLSDQWFVKMAPLAEPALEVVRDGTIKFFPERHAQQYLSWLGEKRDWPISRQLWWGHRIPVWKLRWFGEPQNLTEPETRSFKTSLATEQKKSFEDFARAFDIQTEISIQPSVEICELWVCTLTSKAEGILNELVSANEKWRQGKRNRDAFKVVGHSEEQTSLLFNFASAFFSEVVQDPDVLDTWFSSALWPHSTLGWPEQTADLAKWYPTSVLMTGRDIITLWVARMVMAGLYNMKSIPFHHVAINPTILDGKGERMSKSKGNGVDPVDIIDTHGADALRFTLTSMATETQDVRLPVKKLADGRNTSDRFDIGRNFCNKLWNAARFALANLQAIPSLSPSPGTRGEGRGEGELEHRTTLDTQIHPHPNPLPGYGERGSEGTIADRWIVSRFNRTVEEANAALAIYRFDQYAKTCYDFFWRDFCDWYVETIKPALKDPQRAGQTADILANVLDGALRLMHPMIPFITETIWWRLNTVRPQRGIDSPSKRLILAPWPTPGPIDSPVEQTFSTLQEIIIAIRNVRNEHNADPKKSVTVSIAAASDLTKQSIESNREIIELLASCNIGRIGTEMPPPAGAIRTIAGGCEIFIEGLANLQADVDVTAKQCEALKQKAAVLRSRLSNESYAAKAPAHLVQQTRDELAAAVAEMAKLGCRADD